LTEKVSNALVARMTAIHHFNQWLLLAAVVLHVMAITFYWRGLNTDLVSPMVSGWMAVPAGIRPPRPVRRSSLAAAVLLALAAGFVYWLVVIFPKS
jgi:hypothetical protein